MNSGGLVYRARTVKERLEGLSRTDLDVLKATPHDPTGTLRESGVPRAPNFQTYEEQEAAEYMNKIAPKRIPITREVVARFGPSANCRQCADMASGGAVIERRKHSERCRERMEGLMRDGAEYAGKLQDLEDKRTHLLADYMEARDKLDNDVRAAVQRGIEAAPEPRAETAIPAPSPTAQPEDADGDDVYGGRWCLRRGGHAGL